MWSALFQKMARTYCLSKLINAFDVFITAGAQNDTYRNHIDLSLSVESIHFINVFERIVFGCYYFFLGLLGLLKKFVNAEMFFNCRR